SEWIFAKCIAGGAEHAIGQILATAKEIQYLIRNRIISHRVDREIAPACGFSRRNSGIERSEKIAMSPPYPAIAARQAEVVNRASAHRQLHHAEALAHQIDAAVTGE